MLKQKAQWSYNDFLAYVLLYVATADMEFTTEEKDMLSSKLDIKKHEDVFYIFKKENDYERLQTIISFKDKYYFDDESKEKLLQDIREMFLADQKFRSIESTIFDGLRRIIK